MPQPERRSLDISNLLDFFSRNSENLRDFLEELRVRLDDYHDPAVWISRRPWSSVRMRAEELEKSWRAWKEGGISLPLFGIPFAVKDNIDVLGLDTTAACPAFAYSPEVSAEAVARLEAAGAIVIGKTNMDQFATGLVGMRSPYGTVLNPFHPDYIAGGSSSGSAVAVAAGLVSFALGTDTAGSGRIPAGFNNVVGLKPTRGVISTHGVVPACRSLDCVSVFALTGGDALKVWDQCKGTDSKDAFSRPVPTVNVTVTASQGGASSGPLPSGSFRFGMPEPRHLEFFGDGESSVLFGKAEAGLRDMGGIGVAIDFEPFAEAAQLLYQGPWIAERQAAFGDFLAGHPGEVLPVIRQVLSGATSLSAVDGFRGYYRLREIRSKVSSIFRDIDVLLVPTAPTHLSRREVEADPVGMNSRLGLYTNFVNLLDLCALAVPSGRKRNGLPFGITLIAPAFREAALAGLGAAFHAGRGLCMGTTSDPVPNPASSPDLRGIPDDGSAVPLVRLAVAGLHMSGQPLNGQLVALGARFSGAHRTASLYRAYALDRNGRKFPGLVRQTEGGGAVDVEVWELAPAALGAFMDNVREPLCIGTLELESGEKVKGFLCESAAVGDGEEFTELGGWRAFLERREQA